MEIKKLSIIIIMALSSLVACTKANLNNIKLVFKFETSENISVNPLMCKTQDQIVYFGIPNSKMRKIDAIALKTITVKTKRNDNLTAKAKPLEVLNSNYPSSDSFFSLDTIRNTIGDYIHNDVTWFIIHNNPKNEDKISKIIEYIEISKCSWK